MRCLVATGAADEASARVCKCEYVIISMCACSAGKRATISMCACSADKHVITSICAHAVLASTYSGAAKLREKPPPEPKLSTAASSPLVPLMKRVAPTAVMYGLVEGNDAWNLKQTDTRMRKHIKNMSVSISRGYYKNPSIQTLYRNYKLIYTHTHIPLMGIHHLSNGAKGQSYIHTYEHTDTHKYTHPQRPLKNTHRLHLQSQPVPESPEATMLLWPSVPSVFASIFMPQ